MSRRTPQAETDMPLAETVLADIARPPEKRRPSSHAAAEHSGGKGTHAAVAEIELQAEREPILRYVAISAIERNPKQPRKTFDPAKLDELADSIREGGIRQPLLLTRTPSGRFVIVAGERRWRAAQKVGLTRVPAMIVDGEETELAVDSLVENVQRVALSDLEEAESFLALHNEFGLTHEQIARKLGKSRTYVTNRISTYSKLTPRTKEIILEHSGHANAPQAPKPPRKRGRPPKNPPPAAAQPTLFEAENSGQARDIIIPATTRGFNSTINRMLATLPPDEQEDAALHFATHSYTTRQAEEWLRRGNLCNEEEEFNVQPINSVARVTLIFDNPQAYAALLGALDTLPPDIRDQIHLESEPAMPKT